MEQPAPTPRADSPSMFPPTRWSVVLDARDSDHSMARRALGDFCQAYWSPLYIYARRKGLTPHDAEDRIQAFFHHLLHNEVLHSADHERGKLRAFLLASLKNFLAKQWRDEHTLKRGGMAPHLPIDAPWAERQFLESAASHSPPETLFDRSWAYALLQTVFSRLEAHYDRVGKRETYEAIRPCLLGDGTYGDGNKLAANLDLSAEGLRSAVFKMRRRFREYVEEEIRDTCRHPEDAEEEIRHLCRILSEH